MPAPPARHDFLAPALLFPGAHLLRQRLPEELLQRGSAHRQMLRAVSFPHRNHLAFETRNHFLIERAVTIESVIAHNYGERSTAGAGHGLARRPKQKHRTDFHYRATMKIGSMSCSDASGRG